jgi:hypothetical protein
MDSTLTMSKEVEEKSDPRIIHWVWEDDPDESCCGLDMTGRPFVDDEELPVDCPNCIEAIKFVAWLEENLNG